jgi:hypothetical protein
MEDIQRSRKWLHLQSFYSVKWSISNSIVSLSNLGRKLRALIGDCRYCARYDLTHFCDYIFEHDVPLP